MNDGVVVKMFLKSQLRDRDATSPNSSSGRDSSTSSFHMKHITKVELMEGNSFHRLFCFFSSLIC